MFRALVGGSRPTAAHHALLALVTAPTATATATPPIRTSRRRALGAGGAALSTSAPWHHKQMPPRPQPPAEEEIEEFFLKGSGPGGQKINKTSSAVQLRHKPTGLVVKSQATRSREQNRKIARELLATKLDVMQNGALSRAAIVGDVKKKRADSAAKKARRKYRKLEAAKQEKRDAVAPDADGDSNEQQQQQQSASPTQSPTAP